MSKILNILFLIVILCSSAFLIKLKINNHLSVKAIKSSDEATEDDAIEDVATDDDATEDDATEDDDTEDDDTEDDDTEDDDTEDDATEDESNTTYTCEIDSDCPWGSAYCDTIEKICLKWSIEGESSNLDTTTDVESTDDSATTTTTSTDDDYQIDEDSNEIVYHTADGTIISNEDQ